jgi:cysteine desulfurase
MIYFDNAASTPLYPEVIATICDSLTKDFANPSSNHRLGRIQKEQIDLYQKDFLKLLGTDSADHFIFTSSATESNNTIINGLELKPGEIILYFSGDHKSVTDPIEKRMNSGIIGIEFSFEELINEKLSPKNINTDNVKLIVLSFVNNQSGNILNIDNLTIQLKKMYCKAHIHIDAVQGFGKIPFKINSTIDSASFAAHKIGGPKGIGGLYLKKDHRVGPLLLGGGQQAEFRSSTEAFSLIKGFHLATLLSVRDMQSNASSIETLQSELKSFLKLQIPQIQFPFQFTSPYILCLIIPGISSDILLRLLEEKQIYVSSTSACSSRIKGFNSVLKALVIPEKFHKNVLRISFSTMSNIDELQYFKEVFKAIWSEINYLVK